MTDYELLRQYALHGAQAAFASLVGRYVNLVYSTARRQVRSVELAEEVTQSVFLELSHNATRLPPETHFAAWLYVVSRRKAIDAIRRESRREKREQIAVEAAAMISTSSAWAQVEPVLDDAVSALEENDRRALLLRFFENKTLREIGEALGTNEDTAQKRVSRAVGRLRSLLASRGITATAAGLAAELPLHAVQVAPAGLVPAISAAILLASKPTTVAIASALTKNACATGTRKFVFLAVAASTATVGILFYGSRLIDRQKEQIARLEDQRQIVSRLQADRDAAQARFDSSKQGAAPLAPTSDPGLEKRLRTLMARIDTLKDALSLMPEARTPELQLLVEKDWLTAAQQTWDDASATGIRRGLGFLRLYGKYRFAPLLAQAVQRYVRESNGMLPTDVSQLAAYFNPPMDTTILARYEMLRQGSVSTVPPGSSRDSAVVSEKIPSAFDDITDRVLEVMANGGFSIRPLGNMPKDLRGPIPPGMAQPLYDAAFAAAMAYGRANNLQTADNIEQLLPHFQDPKMAEKVRAVIQTSAIEAPIKKSVELAVSAFRQAHGGNEPPNFDALAPYFSNPEEAAKFVEFSKQHGKVLPKQ